MGEHVVVRAVLDVGQGVADPPARVLGIGVPGGQGWISASSSRNDAAGAHRRPPAGLGADDASASSRARGARAGGRRGTSGAFGHDSRDVQPDWTSSTTVWSSSRWATISASRRSPAGSRRAMLAKPGRAPSAPWARAVAAARAISSASSGSSVFAAEAGAVRGQGGLRFWAYGIVDDRGWSRGCAGTARRWGRRQRAAARRHRRTVTPPASRGSRRSRRSAVRAQPRRRRRHDRRAARLARGEPVTPHELRGQRGTEAAGEVRTPLAPVRAGPRERTRARLQEARLR